MSVFLDIPSSSWLARNALAFAVFDRYPVTLGHTLIITRRVVADWFDASPDEQQAVMALVQQVKALLDERYEPDGYNVGFNAGSAAGQTVPHLHMHVIPRYRGDMPDPRGGVRHVLPERGNYKMQGADWQSPPGSPSASVPGPRRVTVNAEGAPFLDALTPLFARAQRVDIVAAFTQDSGVRQLTESLDDALRRGAQVRLLTGDYLEITQARALTRLLDLERRAEAFSKADKGNDDEDQAPYAGTFKLRVVTNKSIRRSFHPKAWLFRWPGGGVAYVGSSNISRSALIGGVEWNLRLERWRDAAGFNQVVQEMEALWEQGRAVDSKWISAYKERARKKTFTLPPWELQADPPQVFEPHHFQREALNGLAAARGDGHARALVVLATGLGKTWLSVFDVQAFARQHPTPPRVLFLAHRRELLKQAEATFRGAFPDATTGWCVGAKAELDKRFVFASIQKLCRPALLATLAADAFDYVIVDEVHHAAAVTWRSVLNHLQPGFMLGLTATPERADDGDVEGLFNDQVAYRADVGAGIAGGMLAPFRYFGLTDSVDYAPIPWRNSRFEPAALAEAVQTQARMQRLWEGWIEHPGGRSLVFCATIAHAKFVRDWLTEKGVRCIAVYSGSDKGDRASALKRLRDGELDAICSVDLYNEGIDCKVLDRVVMLRPTESPVVFLQQLGRGLRVAPGKEALTVLDFVGNHRVFLDRMRVLLSLGAESKVGGLREFVQGDGALELPNGCSVNVQLEAVQLLKKLMPTGGGSSELVRVYRELRQVRGVRPRLGELARRGLNARSIRNKHGSWMGFVRDEGDLTEVEAAALALGGGAGERWLHELERTPMSKCFKMVVLRVMLDAGALTGALELGVLAGRSHALLCSDPVLFADIEGVKGLPEPRSPEAEVWRSYWMGNPVKAWTKGGKAGARRWFAVVDEQLQSRLPKATDPAVAEALHALTIELLDVRFHQYRRRKQTAVAAGDKPSSFTMKVLNNGTNPILHFGNTRQRDALPRGEVDVRLEDGTPWTFRLVKIACNVARPVGASRNQLPDLLRGWFGPAAGRAGTDQVVRFSLAPDGWTVAPAELAQVLPFPMRGELVTFRDLRAAAGAVASELLDPEDPEASIVRLPGSASADFALRVSGDSMSGGNMPLNDGDWALLKWARSASPASVEGRVVLVQVQLDGGERHLIKRLFRGRGGWVLRSQSPSWEDLPAGEDMQVLARLVGVVRPEELAPAEGSLVTDFPSAFAVSRAPVGAVDRVDGHLFLMVEDAGAMTAPDRIGVTVPDGAAGETAFVLTRGEAGWRYAGVGRWKEEEGAWVVPAVDFATWRALGHGRGASRRLEERWLVAADELVQRVLTRAGQVVEGLGKRCVVVGPSARGGVRIIGVDGAFGERTVSRLDLAWVLVAQADVKGRGGVLDEERVNRVRYLEGTPKGSTRWVDTGWGLVLVGVDGG